MRTSFHHQPEAQHPNFPLSASWQADYPIFGWRIQPIDATPFHSNLARWNGMHMEGDPRTRFTPKLMAEH